MIPAPQRARNREGGYALLFIFAMAAIVAIGLYSQVPKVAFEAQRDKEQLLIDRGEQYSRAILLFVHKFHRFPGTVDELENSNNMRFLRRRYADPMTGKQDWRIVHAGPGGVLIDSVTTKKPDAGLVNSNSIITLNTGVDSSGGDNAGINLAMRQRPSDQPGAAGGDPGSAGGGSGMTPGFNGPVMVLPDGRIVPASTSPSAFNTSAPGTGAPTQGPLATGFQGVPGTPGATVGGLLPSGVAIQQNAPNAQNVPNAQNTPDLPPQVGGPPSSAANLINSILTSPRPGGLNGPGQVVNGQGMPAGSSTATLGGQTPAGTSSSQQNVIGAGIAGIASKHEQEGIKTYNTRTRYNEWEFVYDVTKDPQFARGAAGATSAGGPGGAGAPGAQPPGSPAGGQMMIPGQGPGR